MYTINFFISIQEGKMIRRFTEKDEDYEAFLELFYRTGYSYVLNVPSKFSPS